VVNHEDFGYEVIKKGREALRCCLMRGIEEAWAVLHFDFISALEVGDAQSGGKPGSGGSVGSKEEDDPRVGRCWAERTGPKGRLGQLDVG
jgi:hypothetical protein